MICAKCNKRSVIGRVVFGRPELCPQCKAEEKGNYTPFITSPSASTTETRDGKDTDSKRAARRKIEILREQKELAKLTGEIYED